MSPSLRLLLVRAASSPHSDGRSAHQSSSRFTAIILPQRVHTHPHRHPSTAPLMSVLAPPHKKKKNDLTPPPPTSSNTLPRTPVQLSEPAQVQGAAFALQIGVDALLLAPDKDLWAAAVSAREQRNNDPTKKVSPNASAAAKPPALNGESKSNSSEKAGEGSSTALKASSSSGSGDEKSASGGSSNGGSGKAGGEGAGGSVAGGLTVARVTKTVEGGVGDRVCVDLIQSLKEGEGMLVGSSAKMLALVHAEVYDTGFMPAR